MAEAQNLTVQETADLGEVLAEVLDALFDEASREIAERTGKSGARIPYADRIKIDLAAKMLALAKRYGAEAKFAKFVDASNAIVPTLTRLFGEERIAARLPQRVRDRRFVELCEKAGAVELANLIAASKARSPAEFP